MPPSNNMEAEQTLRRQPFPALGYISCGNLIGHNKSRPMDGLEKTQTGATL